MAEVVLPTEACVPIECFIATDFFFGTHCHLVHGSVTIIMSWYMGREGQNFILVFNNNLLPFLLAFNIVIFLLSTRFLYTKIRKYLSSNTSCFIVCEATCFGPYMTIIKPICESS